MKVRQLIALSALFISTSYSFELIFLDEKHPVYKDSTNLMLEHAMNDFQYYYSCAGRTSGYDLTAAPTYRYLNGAHGPATIHTGGIFLQGRAHYKKLWIKANTMVGGISESGKAFSQAGPLAQNSSFGGFDDLTLELGYDLYQVPKWGGHCSIFILAGIPVNGFEKKGCKSCNKRDSLATQDTVRLGTGFYRLGVGTQCSAIFYCRDKGKKMLTLFTGFQWNHVFSACLHQSLASSVRAQPIEYKENIHPGSEFSIWDALNYNFYDWNFELGVTAQGWANGEYYHTINYSGEKRDIITRELRDRMSNVMRIAVNPYITVAYGKMHKDNPYTISFGVGYEFDKSHEAISPDLMHDYSCLQGFNMWGNVTYSF